MAARVEFSQSLIQGFNKNVQQTTCGKFQEESTEEEITQFEGGRGRKEDTTVQTLLQSPKPCKTLVPRQHNQTSHDNYLERLPSEIIQKILSFLDASSLFNISFVNKQFHDLANNNALWYALYAGEIEKKKWRPRASMVTEALSTASVQGKPGGYFKKLLLKEMAGYRDTMWKKELRHMNPHTGMPVLTEQVLNRLHIQWEITLTQNNGHTAVFEQTHTFFEDSSVTVCWIHGIWLHMFCVASLQLHGIMCPTPHATGDRPRWRSLIHKTKLHRAVQWSFLGSDSLVKLLQFDKCITVGVWRGSWKIAFIMVNLHFHKLIERSLLGSRFCPYIPTEDNAVDPDSGHHGYTLHIVLHNPVRQIMCGHFPRLFTSRVTSQGEYLLVSAIDSTDVSKHIPVGKVSLPWQAMGLEGAAERCCMMTLTVLDEGERPFWCVSSPVKMANKYQNVLALGCEGEQFYIFYEDVEGKVKMVFEWMEELQQYFLVQLIIIFPTAKVKKHFGGKCSADTDEV
ncbi:F-box only protein 15 [Myxocyprinus asiaticus]|uniref:F-box only protein 15 n=1 Tax=Myxocyprinus asiaticus TaxID=70543 RepID=UPI002222CED9|nr:F-box only protein 15 [Myxocyprinus asiaticus]